MAIDQELLALERQFWTGNADFYRMNLDERCLVAFTEMAGVMSREDIAGMVKEGQNWRDLSITEKGVLQIGSDAVILTYQASATRSTGEPYRAIVSSGYVRREGTWKMVFHQQTPLNAS